MANPLQDGPERRQNPRIRCAGVANIIRLPSEGVVVPGKVLNLSLGGCGIETPSPLLSGTRAEIVLRVNTDSIRVLGEVQATRRANVLGVEFLLVSSCGKQLLEELIQELAAQQAEYKLLKAGRLQEDERRVRSVTANSGSAGTRAQVLLSQQAISREVNPAPSKIAAILNGEEIDVFI